MWKGRVGYCGSSCIRLGVLIGHVFRGGKEKHCFVVGESKRVVGEASGNHVDAVAEGDLESLLLGRLADEEGAYVAGYDRKRTRWT